jgi:hypothetical protein
MKKPIFSNTKMKNPENKNLIFENMNIKNGKSKTRESQTQISK